jgi:hypothetical protein
MTETAEDVREAVRWALTNARSHSDLLGLLMPIVYPMPGHDVRPCLVCGRPVMCEPGYPKRARVVCMPCIEAGARDG